MEGTDGSSGQPRGLNGPLDRESVERDCDISFLRGSGPGGQHRNKTETAVRLTHRPTGISVVAQENRSQHRNREAAFERLIEKLEALRRKPKRRRATRKPRSADRKRLDSKRKQADKKRDRRGGHD
ncbi:peptide chain release factor family protein [Engelhardtia mirabilis]|uniref:Peptide chain release factor 2 n=1 Tax=Engelhardtia mirabilis TaxID=2528011 RepID=A0A518BLH1_9BACT|nr:Peptide chain release factor 2 [Planctomycetes bacterium Pla133]QDV02129.1 Peptide chain release factor 2 [Planctomycetes bacterium Pla86]